MKAILGWRGCRIRRAAQGVAGRRSSLGPVCPLGSATCLCGRCHGTRSAPLIPFPRGPHSGDKDGETTWLWPPPVTQMGQRLRSPQESWALGQGALSNQLLLSAFCLARETPGLTAWNHQPDNRQAAGLDDRRKSGANGGTEKVGQHHPVWNSGP